MDPYPRLHADEESKVRTTLKPSTLLIQGVAASIDTLTAGFALADYTPPEAFLSGVIIALVALALCLIGIRIGQKAGQHITRWAPMLAGLILIGIGLEILIPPFL